MDGEQKQVKNRLEVMMPIEMVSGKYSNGLRVSHTKTEFILDFLMVYGSGSGQNVSRIVVNAINIKSFIKTLEENLTKYQERFKIVLPDNADQYIQSGINLENETE